MKTKLVADPDRTVPNIPSVHSFSSRKAWEEAAWNALVIHIAGRKRSTVAKRLLHIILTPAERNHLLRRAAALTRMEAGISYRDIGKELWLTNQTISAVKKALHEHSYRSYNERGKKERVPRKVGSLLPVREPYRKRVRTKYGMIKMRPL
jgi:Trp operon repressor